MANAHMWTIKPTADDMTIAWQGKRIAKLEQDLAALREAVAWERECECVRNKNRMFRNWPETVESERSYDAARAEVDRLMGEG